MSVIAATAAYALLILVLFVLDSDKKVRTSGALWLPVLWLLINGSRPVSAWFQGPVVNVSEVYLEGSPLDRNVYLGLLILAAFALCPKYAKVIRFLRANPAIILFLSYCAISVCWSDYPAVAFKRWIKEAGALAMVLVVLTDRDPATAVKRVFARVGFVLIPVSVLFIKYYPEMSRSYSRWEGRMLVSGVAQDKNMLGMICLVYGLVALWRLFGVFRNKANRSERYRCLAAHGAIVVMVFWLFWKANSMTSMSCFLMAGGLMAVVTFVRLARRPAIVSLMVATAVAIPILVLFLNVGTGSLAAMGRDPTLTGRTVIWSGLLEFAANPLLGTGFQSFWLGERLYRIWMANTMLLGINEAHNGYLEIYLNLGWIGVSLLVVLLLRGTGTLGGNLAATLTAARSDWDSS